MKEKSGNIGTEENLLDVWGRFILRISVLAENSALCPEFGAEHGLSLFIETENAKLLFDMGQTELFAENAKKMGVDLRETDFAVLSHGHYDHGGGLGAFLRLNETAPIYLSSYAFEPHFNAADKYIGLDKAFYSEERFVFCNGAVGIAPRITLYGGKSEIPSETLGAKGMKVLRGNVLVSDDFRHEQYLVIEESGRRYLFSGCSHRGASGIAEYFSPDVFIGGFHFSKVDAGSEAGRALLTEEAKALLKAGGEYYTCHCTGEAQFEVMKDLMGEKLSYISSGQVIEI